MTKTGKKAWRFLAYVLAPPLVLLPPLANFLKSNDYGLLRPESLVAMGFLAGAGLLLGLVMGFRGRFVRAIITAFLSLYFADLQLAWYGLDARSSVGLFRTLLFVTFLGTYALAWVLHEHLGEIITIACGTILAATLIGPGAGPIESVALRAAPGAPRNDLPPIIHIVLDEQIAPEAIPLDVPGGAAARDALIESYRSWGFRLFGRSYSHYRDSHNAIPNLVNFTVSPVNGSYLATLTQPLIVKENAYFRAARERGYRLHVYQSDTMDYCRVPGAEPERCLSYTARSILAIEDADLPAGQKARVIVSRFLGLSTLHSWVLGSYMGWRSLFLNAGLPALPPWRLDTVLVPPTRSLEVLAGLGEDIAAAGRGHLFFVHLLLPHFPHAYDADCTLGRSAASWTYTGDRLAQKHHINTPETRRRNYRNYLRQMACVHVMLGRLIERLKTEGLYDDATVIIHGDHGSRIALVPAEAGDEKRLTDADYADHFAALFAVKAPGVTPGYDLASRSIQVLFAETVFGGALAEDRPPSEEPYVFLRRKMLEPMVRRPMVPFGRAAE